MISCDVMFFRQTVLVPFRANYSCNDGRWWCEGKLLAMWRESSAWMWFQLKREVLRFCRLIWWFIFGITFNHNHSIPADVKYLLLTTSFKCHVLSFHFSRDKLIFLSPWENGKGKWWKQRTRERFKCNMEPWAEQKTMQYTLLILYVLIFHVSLHITITNA